MGYCPTELSLDMRFTLERSKFKYFFSCDILVLCNIIRIILCDILE